MKNILIFMGIFLIMSSCNQNQEQIEKELSLTSDEAFEIAQMHNDYLDISIPKTNGRISSDAIRESFLNQEVGGLSQEEKEILLDQAISFNQEGLKGAIDANSFLFIQKINLILMENVNFEEISTELNVLMEEISNSEIQDKTVLLVYCATAIKSSEYWLPESNGGNGVGSRMIKKQGINGKVSVLATAKEIVVADALAVSGFFTAWGVFAAAGGPGVFFGGAAFAGAFGSAMAAL